VAAIASRPIEPSWQRPVLVNELESGGPRPPIPRGPLSDTVLSMFQTPPGSFGARAPVAGVDALADDDLQLALYCCYELSYRGLAGVDPDWEWDPGLLVFRADLERTLLRRLCDEIGPVERYRPAEVGDALVQLVAGASGPSLSRYLLESGTVDQLVEFCIHRSAYQLKEADPHTFAIPRLAGEAKAAMVEIQTDEYGSGCAAEMHSSLFGATLTALGLDPAYGAYLDRLPAATLATVNLASMFGLHRRWRGALVGHLAVFEMTSVEPMARYSRALGRFGVGASGRRFYDVHVAADARHGVIALERTVAGLVETEPHLGADLLFGAAALMLVEDGFARNLLDAWSTGCSSLLPQGLDVDGSGRGPERAGGVASEVGPDTQTAGLPLGWI